MQVQEQIAGSGSGSSVMILLGGCVGSVFFWGVSFGVFWGCLGIALGFLCDIRMWGVYGKVLRLR